MAAKDPFLYFLAVEAGAWTFGLPVNQIARLARLDASTMEKDGASSTLMLDDKAVTVLDVGARLSGEHSRGDNDLVVQLRKPYADCAVRVNSALEVFDLRRSEIRRVPPIQTNSSMNLPVMGYSPWSKLTASLVRGALTANDLAFSRLTSHGPIHLKDGRLYAGKLALNGDKSIVDGIQSTTNYGCTIFQRDIRVATTATRAGSQVRAIGSKAGEDVSATVLKHGREFRGLTHTIGKDWAIVYRPLIDISHQIVGMVSTYREVSSRLFPFFDVGDLVSAMTVASSADQPSDSG